MSVSQESVVSMRAYASIDGWDVTIRDPEEAVTEIFNAVTREEGFSCVTLNLDHLVKLRTDARFREAYRSATMVTADGAPIVAFARSKGGRLKRTTGADLVFPVAEAAARNGTPVYLFGTSPDVLAKAGQRLAENSDGQLSIAGSASPSRDFDPTGPEADAAIERIRKSGAKLCFVLLGAPKQELFSHYALQKGLKVGFLNFGAGLDFLAGTQTRAPRWMRDSGLEWLWRLASNPRRLLPRYARCALLLADVTIVAPVRERVLGFASTGTAKP